ncbi:MetQ/NlpA family ABC transporter substrate-binding protein [Faunimonas pinastri]|uniref:MetQ/NlpA family ABC transporter substrate-binding protein n=1 Tax=Faunimonas pinastri TaxID=1855383 RepID=UPI000B872287|nr:MetQ/NlpA family ABC transporter substrate-binding protein [Faunimonas pinastri]
MKSLVLAAALSVSISGAALAETIKVGVTPGPHAQIMEKVKEVAAKKGLDITIVEFSDYVVPNQALADGELDANSFQHKPYLDAQVADRGFDLVSVATTVNYPMGVYSRKLKSLSEMPDGGSFGIPNDPTNGGRGLLLGADAGLFKLSPEAGLKATQLDIVENPKHIKIKELDAAQLPRALDDLSAAAINTNYATQGGLDPNKDPLFKESAKSPYVNIIVVRTKDKDKPWVKTLVDSYRSDEVKAFIKDQFKGSVLTSW